MSGTKGADVRASAPDRAALIRKLAVGLREVLDATRDLHAAIEAMPPEERGKLALELGMVLHEAAVVIAKDGAAVTALALE